MGEIREVCTAVVATIRQEVDIDNLVDTAEKATSAAVGNPFAIFALLKKAAVGGGTIQNLIFYNKLRKFLSDINKIPLHDRVNFLDKYVNGKEQEFSYRIIQEIERINDDKKIDFMVLAFRGLIYGKISNVEFFRIVNIINNVLYDDLVFLSENINKDELEPSIEVMALASVGLMYIRKMDANNENTYNFVEFAFKVKAIINDHEIDTTKLVKQITNIPNIAFSKKEW